MKPSRTTGRCHTRRFRSAGGLLFVAAALSLLAPTSTAWAPPRGMAHHRPAIIGTSARTIGTSPPASALSMSSTASGPPEQRPLAGEGDWAAYLDPNYGQIYYFNHATGESAWEPPTPTFPVPRPMDGPPGMDGPMGQMGPMGNGPMGGPMDGPMGGDPRMMRGGPMGPGGPMDMSPQVQNQQQQQGQQQSQQQGPQQQPNFYEILQVPPTATRAQIKQSYLDLVKLYDARMEGGRRSKEFNEIARAWMVLSDGRSRERYDRQLEQWDRERRMREKMMEQEREWMVEQQQRDMSEGMMGSDNKFTRDMVYRKKMESQDADGSNKFGRFRPQQQQQGDGQGFGARPLEIDEEAEARGFEQAQQNAMQERESLMREKAEAEAQLAQEQALERKQRIDQERQREERRRASSERDVIQDRPRGTPLSPMQPGQDMNAMMADMKQKFAQKKTDEAARVNDELTRLQGGGGGGSAAVGNARGGSTFTSPISAGQPARQSDSRPRPKRTPGGARGSMLFPGKGGIVVEDQEFVAKDILLDEFLGRKTESQPSFISWVPPEEGTSSSEAADNIRAAMGNVQGGPMRDGPSSGGMGSGQGSGGVPPAASMSGEQEREQERLNKIRGQGVGVGRQNVPPGGFGSQFKSGPTGAGTAAQPLKTSTSAREQERLQGMKAKAMGFGGRGQQAGFPPPGAERDILITPPQAAGAKTSSNQREQQRLQDMGATGIPGQQPSAQSGGVGNQPKPEPMSVPNVQELEKAHRAEVEQLKQDMEAVASETLEKEIIKIAKIHAAEITKLKDEFEQSRARDMQTGPGEESARIQQLKMNQAAERDRMKAEITREVEMANAEKTQRMQAAHKAEMDRMLSESGDGEATARLQEEIESLKKSHSAELEDMATKHDADMSQLRKELEAKSAEMTKAHQMEIQKLKQDQKAASVADTLKFQEVAMDKLGAKHKQEIERMAAQHEQEMEKLRKELGVNSEQQMRLKVEEVTKSMASQHKLEMDKIAAQHKQEMHSLVQSELQKLQQEHAREMESALAEKNRLHQQAENVKRELNRANAKGGGPTTTQKIDMVLKSFEGVYDPALLEQLRNDLRAREDELNRQIKESNAQMNQLQARLDSTKGAEDKLNEQIQTLSQWKQSAEAELARVKQGTAERTKEVQTLEESIRSTTKEITELKSQLERLTKERDAGKKEIWELREWKKNAEVEREQLEKDLKSKDGVIAKLEYDFKERDEDVNFLVPEVARLQELTVSLEELNKKSSTDYELLQKNVSILKAQYEKESKSAADVAQQLKSQLAKEQTKNSELISTLKGDLKSKEADLLKQQTTANERSRTIAEMKSKLEAYQKESEKAIEDSKRKIALMNAEFDRELARSKAAHAAELEQLKKKLQGEIQGLQQDLTTRSNTIADLKTKLDTLSVTNKKMSGEIIGLNAQRHSTESLLKQSSHSLDAAKREVERLKEQLTLVQRSDSTNMARIKGLERELADKTTAVARLETGANQFASEKERLLADLNNLRSWKDSAQTKITSLSNEIALNAVSNEIGQAREGAIDGVIEMLSSIRNELSQKDVQLTSVIAATDTLLKEQSQSQKPLGNTVQSRPPSGAGGPAWKRSAAASAVNNVVGSGFSSRQRNIATNGSSTMNAYDAAMAASQKEKAAPGQTSNGAVAGQKKKSPGGYLDSL